MHENLAVILQQFNYGKNSLRVFLRGFVCAYYPVAAQGFNPMHTINAFLLCNVEIENVFDLGMRKGRK